MWRWIYSADFGALNAILLQLGLIKHYIPWLTLSNAAMNLVIIADIWHSVPFIALILQAALATLPADLEEAATIWSACLCKIGGPEIFAGVVWGHAKESWLAEEIIRRQLPWRLNVQMHNHIWDRKRRGI